MLKTAAAVLAGKATKAASRLRGGGSALPGLVAERIDPDLLARALTGLPHGVVVVSGTNGKTTTTRMLVAILRAHGRDVFTNPTGSNFTRGVVSAMLDRLPLPGRLGADMAVLELDEAHALRFADAVTPTHTLLLNVARDQLDRFAEIDQTAALLATLAARTSTAVVLNRDDPFLRRIAGPGVPSARYFGLHEAIADRRVELVEVDMRHQTDPDPPPATDADGLLRPLDEHHFEVVFAGAEDVGPIELRQRGLAAMINATAATTTARLLLGDAFCPRRTVAALHGLAPAFGRGEIIDVDGHPLELVLVKNPAAFTVALSTYGSRPVATMIAINDESADGRDVSWLYDVSFTSLAERGVAMASGVRAYDMALRLAYDDVATDRVEPDLGTALEGFLAAHRGQGTRIYCTYTAMMGLRRLLAARYDLPRFDQDAS